MQKRPTPLKPIGPYAYGAIGCGLMLFKYLVEYSLVVGQGGQKYGLLAFFRPFSRYEWSRSLTRNLGSGGSFWRGRFLLFLLRFGSRCVVHLMQDFRRR